VDGAPGQLVVVLLLDPGRAELEGEIAGDLAEQVLGRVGALELEPVVRLDRLGHHHPVDRLDRAPGGGEVALDGPVVSWLVLELVRLEDRQPVDLEEQRGIADHEEHAEVTDLAAHPAASAVWRALVWRAAVSSEMRSSRASNT
jgi:hypothetical protein